MSDQLTLGLNTHHITKAEYLFVVNPPAAIAADVYRFKTEYAELFGNAKFLISKPHITVGNCKLDVRNEGSLIVSLKEAICSLSSFQLQLVNFATFDKNRVLFLVPKPSQILNKIQRLIKEVFRVKFNLKSDSHKGHENPHLTIARAYNDKQFLESKAHFLDTPYVAEFTVEEVIVLKRSAIAPSWELVNKLRLS